MWYEEDSEVGFHRCPDSLGHNDDVAGIRKEQARQVAGRGKEQREGAHPGKGRAGREEHRVQDIRGAAVLLQGLAAGGSGQDAQGAGHQGQGTGEDAVHGFRHGKERHRGLQGYGVRGRHLGGHPHRGQVVQSGTEAGVPFEHHGQAFFPQREDGVHVAQEADRGPAEEVLAGKTLPEEAQGDGSGSRGEEPLHGSEGAEVR